MVVLDIVPIPKPRMTRNDSWKPAAKRYFKYADALRALALRASYTPSVPLSVRFEMPMPASWSEKKKRLMEGAPHLQTPDLDNLIKAFKDALLEQDCEIWRYGAMEKVWAREGRIIVL